MDPREDAGAMRAWLLRLAAEVLDREGSADPSHDADHVARVMALAEAIHVREGGDLPTILAAAALHDVGQERERRGGGDHAEIGAAMAGDLLARTRFPQEAIPAVQWAIREHRLTGAARPASREGRIVYDADKLDCLGAIGVARLFCAAGLHNQKLNAPTSDELRAARGNPATLRRLRRTSAYASSVEFELLLADLPDELLTPTGREMARERHAYMRDFFDRLRREVAGQL